MKVFKVYSFTALIVFLSTGAYGQAGADASTTAAKTYDSYSGCHAIASKVDQDGYLRMLTVGEDDDQPTFGLFNFTDKGDVDLNLNSPDRGNVTNFSMVNGTRVLKVSQGKRFGLKTDIVEHDFSSDPGKLSIYETGAMPKGLASVTDGNRWGVNWSFKVNAQNNTCSLDHITIGTQGSPNPSVAFDLSGCEDLLVYQSKWWPEAQYCSLVSDGVFSSKGMNTNEFMRLEQENVLTPDSHATPAYLTLCKMYNANTAAQQLMKQKKAAAGDLCDRSQGTSLINYTQKYYAAHPQVPVGGTVPETAATSAPAAKSAQ